MTVTLAKLNTMSQADFIVTLKAIYEHSPWVAEAVVDQRPFSSIDALAAAMQEQIDSAAESTQRYLIDAHPELGSRKLESLTADSQREQRGAGLDGNGDKIERLLELNRAYRERHGFPFIIAVSGLSIDDILAALQSRLPRDTETEQQESLRQIARIARIRLEGLIDAP